MGPVHWLAVVVAALAAMGWALVWYVWLFRGARAPAAAHLAVMAVPAWLMGHNFARIGEGVLMAKPWLYWMMSGGFALTMIAPVLAVVAAQRRLGLRAWAIDAGYWLAAFLLMGTVFRLAA